MKYYTHTNKETKMKTIGIIYEITGNPYFGDPTIEYSEKISEYVYPSEINDICKALASLNYHSEIIDGPKGLLSDIQNGKKCDLYFNKSIGFKGLERKIGVPAIALLYNLPIIGSNAYTMTLCRHKFHTNRLLSGMGFKVPDAYYVSNLHEIPIIQSYPVIVKPNEESDSLGISEKSVCFNICDVTNNISNLLNIFRQPIVIEEYISGEEWKVAVIGNNQTTHAYGGVNSLKNGNTMRGTLQTRDDILKNNLSYTDLPRNKYYSEALRIAESIHNLLGLNDYSRCDFRLKNNKLYCMEISTHPFISNSMTYSSFVKAAQQELPSYESVISQIINSACKRYNL
jgi:D-alanine-D-alanine ligase